MRIEARDPFEYWYPLTTVAERLGRDVRTVRRWMESGRFGPPPGLPGCLLRHLEGEWCFPWAAVAGFLRVSGEETPSVSVAWKVRTEGELRRKLAALQPVQTSGAEVGHE